MKNKVEIKGNIVCKTYASRMDYVKEESLYKKLKGTGLAPELLDSHDGYLEHEYVVGESFLDVLATAKDDYAAMENYFRMFFTWYEKYRELTKMTLGQVRFDKFVVVDGRLVNLDFEHSKPGYMEDDFARLVAQICLRGDEPYSVTNIESAKFFIYAGNKYIEYRSEILYDRIIKAIKSESKLLGKPVNEKKMEAIATYLTSAGIVFAGGDTALSEVSKDLMFMPQRFVSVPKGRGYNSISLDGFLKVHSGAPVGHLLRRMVEAQNGVREAWTVCVTADMPRIPEILWNELLSADKNGYAAVMVEANGKLREFPLLLNTSMTRLELQNALDKGEKSLIDVLSRMSVNVIKVEDIRTK